MDSEIIAALIGATATLLSVWLKFYFEQQKEKRHPAQTTPLPSPSVTSTNVPIQEIETKVIVRGIIGALAGSSFGALIGGITGYVLYSAELDISLGIAVGATVLGVFGIVFMVLWKIYPSASLGIGIGATVGAIWGANTYVKGLGFMLFANWNYLFIEALKSSFAGASVGAVSGMILGILLRWAVQKIYATQPFS